MNSGPDLKQYMHCPFDKTHVVESCKMRKHIMKCKAPCRKDYKPCPYNQYHWYHFQIMPKHLEECPDRNGKGKVSNNNVAFKPPADKFFQPKMALDESFIRREESSILSSIPINQDNSFDQDIEMINIHFKSGFHEKVETHFDVNLKKKKISKELRDLGQAKLWREPNFTEWFDSQYSHDKRFKNLRAPVSVNRYFD